MAWGGFDETVLNLGELDEVAGHHVGLVVAVKKLHVALEEQVGTGEGDVEVQLLEHLTLHLQDLLLGVRLISDVHKISQVWWVDLFILTGREKGGNAHQLELLSGNLGPLQVTIDQINRQEEGLIDKLKLEMDVDEPVDENGAHFLIDIGLLGHVAGLREKSALVGSEGTENFLGVWGDLLWDVAVAVVDVVHVVDGPKINFGGVE